MSQERSALSETAASLWLIRLRWLLLIPGSALAGVAVALFVSIPAKIAGVLLGMSPADAELVHLSLSCAGFAFAFVLVGMRTAPGPTRPVGIALLLLMLTVALIATLRGGTQALEVGRWVLGATIAAGALVGFLRGRPASVVADKPPE